MLKFSDEDVENRPIYNAEIIQLLDKFFTQNPHMRFIQGLWSLGIIERDKDDFYEESRETLEQAREIIALGKRIKRPCTLEEACAMIREKCNEAIGIYDNEEFYEDDCDLFLGEKSMAETVLEILDLVKGEENGSKD